MRSPASRLGSPGANSHPSTRPVHARGPTAASPGLSAPAPGSAGRLATWASAGLDGSVAAGEAQAARARGRPVAGAARDVRLDPVDPHRADLAAARADRVRPGRADGGLLAGTEVLEALEHLHVPAEADREVVPGDRPLAPRGVDRDRLEAHLPRRAARVRASARGAQARP